MITTTWRAWFPPPPDPRGYAGLIIDVQAPVRGTVECMFRLDDPGTHALLRQVAATGRLGFLVAPPGDRRQIAGTLLKYLLLEVSAMPDGLRDRLRRPPPAADLPQPPKVGRGQRGGGKTPAA